MDDKISCIIVDDEPVARNIIAGHLSKIDNITIIGSCANAIEAIKWINSQQVDLIFLDINMPEISGLSLAKLVNKETKVIFITAYREYALDGFDLQAVDYLLKPVSFERLFKAIKTYYDVYHKKETPEAKDDNQHINDFIFVRADRKMVKINFSDIIYMESLSDYLKIHTTASTIITRETINNIEAKLPYQNFIRVHRSFIISIAQIDSYTNENVELKGNTIPISRGYKTVVLERLEGI